MGNPSIANGKPIFCRGRFIAPIADLSAQIIAPRPRRKGRANTSIAPRGGHQARVYFVPQRIVCKSAVTGAAIHLRFFVEVVHTASFAA